MSHRAFKRFDSRSLSYPQGMISRLTVAALLAIGALAPVVACAGGSDNSLRKQLAKSAPQANAQIIALALKARHCAIETGIAKPSSRLAIIDFTRPSTVARLWLFDLDHPSLVLSEPVAHGRESGGNFARSFSNVEGSAKSSLGLFKTSEAYTGNDGYALRMDGLEPGVNDNARLRNIVIHGAWYVDPQQALKQGRLGRSLGCPSVRMDVIHPVVDNLKQGQMLFAYYPDPDWLARSPLLHCDESGAAQRTKSAPERRPASPH
ncbi:MAG: murein L,D-transpeptidase catalytic domain family protein [Dokdonella sp.]